MTKKLTISIAVLATCAHVAVMADMPKSTASILSRTEFETGGVTVKLAKTMQADGRVCQEYVSSIVRASDGDLKMTISKVCDKPVTVLTNAPFPDEVYPAKLKALHVVRSADGLTHQVPVLAP